MRSLGLAILALGAACAQVRVLLLALPLSLLRGAEVVGQVLRGEPDWRVYQSRLLGPWLLDGVPLPLGDAYPLFALACFFLAGWGLLVSQRSLVPFLLLHWATLLLAPALFLYPWDLLALPIFVAFHVLALRGAWRAVAALAAVALLSHEVSLALAVWLVLDPLLRWARGGPLERAPVVAGVLLLAGGAALLEGLRSALLVRESLAAEQLAAGAVYGGSAHLTLLANVDSLAHALTPAPGAAFPFVVPAFLIAVVGGALRLRQEAPALAVVALLMLAACLCFGLVFETRVLFPLVPFVAIAWGRRESVAMVGRHASTAYARPHAHLDPR